RPEHALVQPQSQRDRHGVQARRYQSAERPFLGELDIGMERLRIPLPGEIDDGRLGHGEASAGEPVADLEIFVIANAHGSAPCTRRARKRGGIGGAGCPRSRSTSEPRRPAYLDSDCVESRTSALVRLW